MLKLTDMGYKKVTGDLGIEIEVEGKKTLPVLANSIWTSKPEDSLRLHGMEYVTKVIPCDDDKIKHLQWLHKSLAKYEVLEDSPRTSVHVHVNVGKLTPLQVLNVITAYWLVENVLVRWCGEDREGNLFCLRLKDAEYVIDVVTESLKHSDPFSQYTDKVRYAGMNLNALRKFGSLEFRSMRGTVDPKIIDLWSSELINLRDKAAKFNSPEHIFETMLSLTKMQFLGRFFSLGFVKELTALKGWQELMDENAPLVVELAYHEDWDKWQDEKEKQYKEKPDKVRAKKPSNWDAPYPPPIQQFVNTGLSSTQAYTIMVDDPNA